MWLFLNILYVTVWSLIKCYVIGFFTFYVAQCFSTQNTPLVTAAVLIYVATAPGTASHRQRAADELYESRARRLTSFYMFTGTGSRREGSPRISGFAGEQHADARQYKRYCCLVRMDTSSISHNLCLILASR